MFRYGTTFVVGAGASAEFGMPVGADLAKMIRKSALLKNLNSEKPTFGDQTFYDTLKRLWPNAVDREKPIAAAEAIHHGVLTAVSIDAFIDRFHDDEFIPLVGKMLIALEISKAEAQSSLSKQYWTSLQASSMFVDKNTYGRKLINPDDTWLGQFTRILFDGVRNPQQVGAGINIICFNYDRCIEYYLRTQIAAAYRMSISEAQDIVRKINIIHPYGTLGELPLMPNAYGDQILEFGAERDEYFKLEDIAKTIKTYTERQHQPDVIKRIHDAIAHSNVLTFLGFGFNNQNLDLLRVGNLDNVYSAIKHRPIYSTGKGIEKQVESTIKRRILQLLFPNEKSHEGIKHTVQIEYGQTCSELLYTHNMNLSSFQQAYFAVDEQMNATIPIRVRSRAESAED